MLLVQVNPIYSYYEKGIREHVTALWDKEPGMIYMATSTSSEAAKRLHDGEWNKLAAEYAEWAAEHLSGLFGCMSAAGGIGTGPNDFLVFYWFETESDGIYFKLKWFG